MEAILQMDVQVFEWINQNLHNNFLDNLMPWWRSKYTWIPFYVLLVLFVAYKYRIKAIYLVLAMAISVGVSDIISSKVIKNSVKRLRPCKNPQLKNDVKLLVRCGSGYSFTSSHATNHFTLAVFLLFTFCRRFKFLRLPLLLWAASIAFGQVYVGVHYPLDVMFGALLGTFIGWSLARLYRALIQYRIEDFYRIV